MRRLEPLRTTFTLGFKPTVISYNDSPDSVSTAPSIRTAGCGAWLRLLFRARRRTPGSVVARARFEKPACSTSRTRRNCQERIGRRAYRPAPIAVASTRRLPAGRKKNSKSRAHLETAGRIRHRQHRDQVGADRCADIDLLKRPLAHHWYPSRVHHDTRRAFGAPHGTAARGTAAPGRGRPPPERRVCRSACWWARLIRCLPMARWKKNLGSCARAGARAAAMCCCVCRTS